MHIFKGKNIYKIYIYKNKCLNLRALCELHFKRLFIELKLLDSRARAPRDFFIIVKIKFSVLKSSVFYHFKINLERRLLLKSKPGEAGHTFEAG